MSARLFRCRKVELSIDASREGSTIRLRRGAGETQAWEIRRLGVAEFGVREASASPRHRTVFALRDGGHWWLHVGGRTYDLELVVPRTAAPSAGDLTAPIPGTVAEVTVRNGDAVEAGQVVVVISAMKMQLEIKAPHAGVVRRLDLTVGDPVVAGRELLRVEAPDDCPTEPDSSGGPTCGPSELR